jgi:hypothetical protein
MRDEADRRLRPRVRLVRWLWSGLCNLFRPPVPRAAETVTPGAGAREVEPAAVPVAPQVDAKPPDPDPTDPAAPDPADVDPDPAASDADPADPDPDPADLDPDPADPDPDLVAAEPAPADPDPAGDELSGAELSGAELSGAEQSWTGAPPEPRLGAPARPDATPSSEEQDWIGTPALSDSELPEPLPAVTWSGWADQAGLPKRLEIVATTSPPTAGSTDGAGDMEPVGTAAAGRAAQMGPLVSVVLVTHEWSDGVAATVASVLAQSYLSWELLVVDDRAGAPPPPLLAGGDGRVRVLAGPRLDVAAARSRALEACQGPVLAYLEDDEIMAPGCLAALVSGLAP